MLPGKKRQYVSSVAPEPQQPPHWQWMKPSVSPPPLSRSGCRGDSDRFAWKKPFRSVRRGPSSVKRHSSVTSHSPMRVNMVVVSP
ncbi:hypothetical protein F2P81_006877 [Scophthalmus maximus]|uniref:Uncharacterized protein n=1 Tax=Scophthalmus maximus TaxID=52904 RepID=A0A6A4T7Z9_SCOMX|nr:hypothetical protein F2P81_006877 [Scophthalmus maximus]